MRTCVNSDNTMATDMALMFSWIPNWNREYFLKINPFTPKTKSDQFQISSAPSPEIFHHTVWRAWLFIAYSDERWLCYQSSLPHLYFLSLKADLDGTTLTYDCRMQLAKVMTCGRLSLGFEKGIKSYNFFRVVCDSLGEVVRLIYNPCRMDDASKLPATVVSQSCVV